MPALIASIVFAVALGHIMKFAMRIRCHVLAVTTINYGTASLVSLILVVRGGHPAPGIAAPVGIVAGIFYVVGLMLNFRAIRTYGIGLSSAVSQLSLAIPVLLALVVWHEPLTATRLAGLGLVGLALPLLTMSSPPRRVAIVAPPPPDAPSPRLIVPGLRSAGTAGHGADVGPFRRGVSILLWVFIVQGLSRTTAKVQEEVAPAAAQPVYLLVLFVAAFTCAALMQVRARESVTLRDVVVGILLGAANLAMTLFLLRALTALPAIIVFPTASCGTLALAVVTARWIWGERPPYTAVIGLGIALVAVGLLAR